MNKKRTITIFCFIIFFMSMLLIIILNSNKLLKFSDKTQDSKFVVAEAEYDISSYVTDEIISNSENAKMSALYDQSILPENIKSRADYIAIVRVISCDYATTEYDNYAGHTFGKMLVNNVIKGDLNTGDVFNFASIGGYLTIEEWEKNQPKEANEKRDYLRQLNGIVIDKSKTYINVQFDKCVNVKAGKTYLAYFTFNEKMEAYEIIGFHNGFLELDVNQARTISVIEMDFNNVKVLNNNTREYENLNEYIETNIGG